MAKGKAESLFAEMGKKIDEIAGKIANSETIKEIDLDKRIEELKKTRDHIEKELQKVASENKDAVKDIINELDKGIDKLRDGFKEAFRKREKK